MKIPSLLLLLAFHGDIFLCIDHKPNTKCFLQYHHRHNYQPILHKSARCCYNLGHLHNGHNLHPGKRWKKMLLHKKDYYIFHYCKRGMERGKEDASFTGLFFSCSVSLNWLKTRCIFMCPTSIQRNKTHCSFQVFIMNLFKKINSSLFRQRSDGKGSIMC